MDFLKWYKNKIESAREEPPLAVWEEIQNELDIDAVWNNLDKELPARRNNKILTGLAIAASFLGVIGLGTLLYTGFGDNFAGDQFVYQNNYNPDAFLRQNQEESNPINSLLTATLDFPENNTSWQDAVSPDNVDEPAYRQNAVSLDDAEVLAYRQNNHLQPLTVHGYKPEYGVYDIKSNLRSGSTGKEESNPGNAIPSMAGYYAGMTGHLANTWLLNQKTLQGLRSDELTASLPSFGYSFGFMAGKSIKSFDIQAEFHIVSLTRQEYNEYLHGQYINNRMQFRYSGFSLLGRWVFLNSSKGKHSLLMGAYTGLLRNAVQNLNGESLSLNNEYRSTDYGIISGYEYSYPLGNNLMLGTGFQTKLGLNNIFAGNDLIPDYLNSTRNASVNLILSIRYNLK